MESAARGRLGAIQRALQPVNRRPRPAMSSSDVGSGPPKLLTDTQVKDFIKDGMLLLPIEELPTSFHEGIYHKCAETWARAADEPRDAGLGHMLGRFMFERLPELTQIINSPTLRGALTSILGPDYVQHPHRTMHVRELGEGGGPSSDQGWCCHYLPAGRPLMSRSPS